MLLVHFEKVLALLSLSKLGAQGMLFVGNWPKYTKYWHILTFLKRFMLVMLGFINIVGKIQEVVAFFVQLLCFPSFVG